MDTDQRRLFLRAGAVVSPTGNSIRRKTISFANAGGKCRRGYLRCAMLCSLTLLAAPANAELFGGIRLGAVNLDVDAAGDPKNLALYLGFQVPNQLADISLAGEVSRSFDAGKTRRGGDLEFESEALYLVVRSTSSLFVSLRGGFVRDKVVTDRGTQRDDGFLFGGGVGVVSGRVRILLEYTSIADDADFLSLNFEF